MAEIRHRQQSGAPEISSAEIVIPNDAEMGSGTYTITFRPSGFPVRLGKSTTSAMVNRPAAFQISVTVNGADSVNIILGRAAPVHAARFLLPKDISPTELHVVKVQFHGWRLTAAALDGSSLAKSLDAPKATWN